MELTECSKGSARKIQSAGQLPQRKNTTMNSIPYKVTLLPTKRSNGQCFLGKQ